MFLLDTNILSELRKGRPAHPPVQAWAAAELIPGRGYVSVIALGEIRSGIDRLARRDSEGAAVLDHWHLSLAADYADRVLPVTREIADEWGRLNVTRTLPTADSLMAATARVHGLAFATRNTADLADTETALLDPFHFTA